MYAAVDKSLLKENTTKAVVLVNDNTHERGICFLWTQIYHQLRYISLVLLFVFMYITIPLWLNLTTDVDVQHGTEMYAVVNKSLLKKGM